jgi:hypothetical protein
MGPVILIDVMMSELLCLRAVGGSFPRWGSVNLLTEHSKRPVSELRRDTGGSLGDPRDTGGRSGI